MKVGTLFSKTSRSGLVVGAVYAIISVPSGIVTKVTVTSVSAMVTPVTVATTAPALVWSLN